MTTVEVREPHQLGVEGARSRLGPFSEDLKKYGMSIAWSGAKAELKGTAASGSVEVTSTEVRVTVKLGLIAKAAGVKPDKLHASIQKRLATALSTPPASTT